MEVQTTATEQTEFESLKHECLPFTAIPHTTDLYRDYLFHHNNVSKFYPNPPTVKAVEAYAGKLDFPAERRALVADVLERQNRSWGAGPAILESLERLRKGAVAVLSGQQVGLFGGPLYSVLKAASAIQLARELTEKGIPAVPVFWLATEDHDLAEINHNFVIDGAKQLKSVQALTHSDVPDAPVGHIKFDTEIVAAAEGIATNLGDSEIAKVVLEIYAAGEYYGDSFARLFIKLLGDYGLIMLDPLDPEIHRIAASLYRVAIEQAEVINADLLARGKELQAAGYHEQVKVTPQSTLLFSLAGGSRKVIHRNGDSGFAIGARKVTREELLKEVDQHPEDFSSNVLFRPIVEDFLLPTVAYFGGAAEVAYFAQLEVVFRRLLGRVTPVMPRLTATIVNGRMQRLLKRYRLAIPDLFHGAEKLQEVLATKALPVNTQQEFANAEDNVRDTVATLQRILRQIDPSLVDAAERSGRKMQFQIKKITAKAAHAQLRKNEQLAKDADEILAMLFPHKGLQERTLAGVQFVAAHGSALIDELFAVAAEHCPGHHLIYV